MFKTNNLKAFTLKPRKNILKVFSTPKKYDKFLSVKKYTDLNENQK